MNSPVVVQAAVKQTATVIFLHGLGDTGHGWAAALKDIALPYVKYICPTAPTMPVTINMGMRMPAWFDIKNLDSRSDPETQNAIRNSSLTVHQLINDELSAGIDSKRILVGGFSQGGAVALYSAFTYDKPLAGIVALSTFFPVTDTFAKGVSEANRNICIFHAHGDSDDLITPAVGNATADALRKVTANLRFKMYSDMGHSSSEEEMNDVEAFIKEKLPPTN